ncbi:MAG: OmpA family protein [Flavobacteriales bacterium]|nr:OmpA family protein [Flavobacteriales bacterium]
MNAKALIVVLSFLLWAQVSWRWYTHGIKGFYALKIELPDPIDVSPEEPESTDTTVIEEEPEHLLHTDEGVTIFFPYKEADQAFRTELASQLVSLVEDMSSAQRPITIAGHTDQKGSESYNLELGEERARFVAEILAQAGLKTERMMIKSFGESRPLAEEESPDAVWMNRRVEIKWKTFNQ